jgi:hypothetical protein
MEFIAMNKVVSYSIVRFLPYARREEFVNIGVVAYCEQAQWFDFRLVSKNKVRRVHECFPTLTESHLFSKTIGYLEDELLRVKQMLSGVAYGGLQIFQEVVRPKDGLIQFSRVKATLQKKDQSFDLLLQSLFNELVAFDSEDYQGNRHEQLLETRFKQQVLATHELGKYYRRQALVNESLGVKATLPFYNADDNKSIKTLSFAGRATADKVTNHAFTWLANIEKLTSASLIQPKKHLVVYENTSPKLSDVVQFNMDILRQRGVMVAHEQDIDYVNDFLVSSI